MTNAKTIDKARRLVSLDLFRGLTIFGMILVNNPGTWGAIYPPLKHADWHGCTFTDLIFPFFLFMVGMSINLSLDGRIARGVSRGSLATQIVRRSAMLFFLGLFLAAYKDIREWHLDLSTLRIMGVLQRIAVCYLVSGLVYLKLAKPGGPSPASHASTDNADPAASHASTASNASTDNAAPPASHASTASNASTGNAAPVASHSPACASAETLLKICAVILIGYYLLMRFVPVPGFGAGDLDSKEGNLAAWIDRAVLGKHVWSGAKVYDPEGLLSTFPAIATCLLGILCAAILKRPRSDEENLMDIFAWGSLLVIAGWMSTALMPLNKALWTSSYVLYTGGLAFAAFGLCFWCADYHKKTFGTGPFIAMGTNALFIFMLSGVIGRELYLWKVGDKFFKPWLFDSFFATWLEPRQASFAFSVCFAGVMVLIAVILYRKKIIIKV